MKSHNRILSALCAAALVLPCSAFANRVEWTKDKITGAEGAVIACPDLKLDGGSFVTRRYLNMKIIGLVVPQPLYFVRVELTLPNWMFISSGPSLVLNLDGYVVPLSGDGSSSARTVLGPDTVMETADYGLTPEQISTIGNAHKVLFRLAGDQASVTGEFTDKTIASFRTFSADAVPKIEATHHEPSSKGLRAGIKFLPGPKYLQVLMVDSGSPNQAFLNRFILAVDGSRGSGLELQSKLYAAIAAHQDGSSVKVIISDGPGFGEREDELRLF